MGSGGLIWAAASRAGIWLVVIWLVAAVSRPFKDLIDLAERNKPAVRRQERQNPHPPLHRPRQLGDIACSPSKIP